MTSYDRRESGIHHILVAKLIEPSFLYISFRPLLSDVVHYEVFCPFDRQPKKEIIGKMK